MRHFFHDGDTVTLSDDYLFSQEDWIIDYDRNENNEILNSSGSKVLKFVGIIINQDNQDVVISFPKKYRVTDIEKDTELILQVLIKDYSENIGEKQVESNYPFASFFYVYDFFKDYGLIYTNKVFNKANVGGKINWDYTIKNSMKFISNGSLIHIPLYFKKKHPFSDFLTECIIYCIDYTLDKFQMIIKLEKTGHKFPEYNFFQDKKYVLDRLYSIRNNTFSDLMLNLIDELIKFLVHLTLKEIYI
ncbi:LlaJI family restriction endonuclease [Carnobacterium mobile]|uniref:LlaJI family restriction endonuclease n=1 Tax=Carnobacterium mobile TaxID=2750 RepID=UPI00054E7F45|nr:LlaJI family restriction endonuclease [Carnobacterium mobile]